MESWVLGPGLRAGGRTDERTDRRMYGRTDERVGGRIGGWAGKSQFKKIRSETIYKKLCLTSFLLSLLRETIVDSAAPSCPWMYTDTSWRQQFSTSIIDPEL